MNWVWIVLEIFIALNILTFLIYWFELDDKFIRSFESTFMKMSKKYKAKHS